MLVVVYYALDGDTLLPALHLSGLEDSPCGLVLLQQVYEFVVVDEIPLGVDQRLDDLFLEREYGLLVVLGLPLEILLDAVDLLAFEHDELLDQSLLQDLLGDLEIQYGVVDVQFAGDVGAARLVAQDQSEIPIDVDDILVVLAHPTPRSLAYLRTQYISREVVQLLLDQQHQDVSFLHGLLDSHHRRSG